jgi:hypothetical protein
MALRSPETPSSESFPKQALSLFIRGSERIGRALLRFVDQCEKFDIANEVARYRHWQKVEDPNSTPASIREIYREAVSEPRKFELMLRRPIKEWGDEWRNRGEREAVLLRRHEEKFIKPWLARLTLNSRMSSNA